MKKTVATVWELNFRHLEKDSSMASELLILFSFLELGDISELMLRRGCLSKKIWGADGEISKIDPLNAGLDPELVNLLDEEMQFDHVIEQLLAFSLVQRNSTVAGKKGFSVHPLVQHCARHRVSARTRQKWQVQAILLIAHAFPFDVYIDEE